MSYSPPQEIPDDVVEMLDEQSPEVFQYIDQYAEELAEHREREARLAEQDEEEHHDKGNQRQPLLLLAVAGR